MKPQSKFLLILIFLLAFFLRVYKLGEFPVGFHVDEVKVGWNALSLLKTTRDDHGNDFPFYYNSFGDYRPAGIFYVTMPSIAIFGNTEFATRLPSALFGALSVFPLFLFVRQLSKSKLNKNLLHESTALLASFLLAISFWHIEVSRATSEVIISNFLVITSLYLFVRAIDTKKKSAILFILSFVFLVISYLFYHTIRLVAPLIFILISAYFWKTLTKETKKNLFVACGAIILLTLIFSSTTEARARISQISIFNDVDVLYQYKRLKSESSNLPKIVERLLHTKISIVGGRFVEEYGSYFSTDFLIGNAARPYRYVTPGIGLLSYVEIIFLAVGVIQMMRGNKNFLPLLLLLVAPISSALTTEDVPNLHRALLMLPFLMIIESYGFEYLVTFSKKYKKKIVYILSFLIALNLFYFLHMYFVHSQIHRPFLQTFVLDNPSYRNNGAKELTLRLDKLKEEYGKIVVTNYPDDPYPWYAFFTGKDPAEFNKFAVTRKDGPWMYRNILFSQMRCPSDDAFVKEEVKKLLVVDAGDPVCAYNTKIKDGLAIKIKEKIYRPDGSEVYALLERK